MQPRHRRRDLRRDDLHRLERVRRLRQHLRHHGHADANAHGLHVFGGSLRADDDDRVARLQSDHRRDLVRFGRLERVVRVWRLRRRLRRVRDPVADAHRVHLRCRVVRFDDVDRIGGLLARYRRHDLRRHGGDRVVVVRQLLGRLRRDRYPVAQRDDVHLWRGDLWWFDQSADALVLAGHGRRWVWIDDVQRMVVLRWILGHLRQHGHTDADPDGLRVRRRVVRNAHHHGVALVYAQHERDDLRQRQRRGVVVLRQLLGHLRRERDAYAVAHVVHLRLWHVPELDVQRIRLVLSRHRRDELWRRRVWAVVRLRWLFEHVRRDRHPDAFGDELYLWHRIVPYVVLDTDRLVLSRHGRYFVRFDHLWPVDDVQRVRQQL